MLLVVHKRWFWSFVHKLFPNMSYNVFRSMRKMTLSKEIHLFPIHNSCCFENVVRFCECLSVLVHFYFWQWEVWFSSFISKLQYSHFVISVLLLYAVFLFIASEKVYFSSLAYLEVGKLQCLYCSILLFCDNNWFSFQFRYTISCK